MTEELKPELPTNLENWVSYPETLTVTLPTDAGQKAAEQALQAIKDRSFSGRNPQLGKMINCQFCGMRHREHDTMLKCKQKFVKELIPPEGLTDLTARQVLGAKFFAKRRQQARNRPKNKMHYWLRIIIEARKKKDAETV